MTTERVAGKFVRKGAEPREPSPQLTKSPAPARSKSFARARFAEALPGIMTKLLEQVLEGSVPHLKVLLELTGMDKEVVAPPKSRRRMKSLEQTLLEQWKRDGEEQAARKADPEAGNAVTN